jgi:tetratricopeptide (TPR) repeat protein
MKRADAFAVVKKRGGKPREGVTKDTGLLIVGELGWPLLDDGRPSNSLAKAKSYGIPIASERQFLEWIGHAAAEDQTKTYTADQLSALSKVPTEVVEQLAMFGLIEPRGGLYGFRDLAAARQIAGLLASGVALSAVTKSLADIRKWLPDARLSNLKLFPESSDRILIEQIKGKTDKKGQFQLEVTRRDDDADTLFGEAQAAEESGDSEAAERLYRRAMTIDPRDPAAAFNLANLLRATGRAIEAEAIYRKAVERDPDFAEAWYNLADVLDDQGRTTDGIAALKKALEADAAYADAMFNLALFLQKLERYAEAMIWWRQYLERDADSQWSVRAKRALKLCEIQVAGSS